MLLSITQIIVLSGKMISEQWIGMDVEGSCSDYPEICLEGLRKTMKNLSQDSWSQDQDLNLRLPKSEAVVLTAWLWCLVCIDIVIIVVIEMIT
jgi:hypothetical protein